jgi:hypothetical protein
MLGSGIPERANPPPPDRSPALLAQAWAFGPASESSLPQLRGAKRAAFAANVVVLCALAAGVLLGLHSLMLGWVQDGSEMMHRVHDIAWGAFSVILVCGAAAAQLWRPERRPAAMQQLLACLAVGGLSMAASGALVPSHMIRGTLLAVPAAAMIALHPARRDVLRGGRVSLLLTALSIVVAVPLVRFALEQVRIQRIDTSSPHGIAFHWGTMATLALGIVATMIVASIRAPGWRLSAWCAGAALTTFGLASAVYPDYASSVGRVWGICAIALAIVFVVVAEHQLFVQRRTEAHEASVSGAGAAGKSTLDETWAA